MPYVSEKQRRLMHAAASGRMRKKDGPTPEQARSFMRHSGETPPTRTRKLLNRVKGRY